MGKKSLISLKKKYRLDNGAAVVIHSISGKGPCKVIGQYQTVCDVDGGWAPMQWDEYGNPGLYNKPGSYSLVEIDPYEGIALGEIVEITTSTGGRYYKEYALNGQVYNSGIGSTKRLISGFKVLHSVRGLGILCEDSLKKVIPVEG